MSLLGFPSDAEMYREQSFSSTQTGSWTTASSNSDPRTNRNSTRDFRLKMQVKAFLQANGFMHINEAQHAWGRTRTSAETYHEFSVLFRIRPGERRLLEAICVVFRLSTACGSLPEQAGTGQSAVASGCPAQREDPPRSHSGGFGKAQRLRRSLASFGAGDASDREHAWKLPVPVPSVIQM